MDIARMDGIELEYEVTGSGEPVLLISPVLADGFAPLVAEPALAERYRLIRYHKRGWVGSTHTDGPVPVGVHVTDAVALLRHLGLACAHVVGHSSGAAVAAQLAVDHPDVAHTVGLLELSLLSVPSGAAFFEQAGPAFAAYAAGEPETALALFLSVVGGTDWPTCRALLDERLPGAVEQAVKDADTFFGVELPALAEWRFDATQAAAVRCPVLSVLGADTLPLWEEVAAFLAGALADVETRTVDGVGHLLHVQDAEPVAAALADFLGRHPMDGG